MALREFEPSDADVQYAVRWLAEQAAKSRRNPADLYQFVLREETSRRRIVIAPHQLLILEFVMAHPKCVVRAPVGFGKTYLMTALTLWLLGDDVTQRGVVLSAVQTQSKKIVDAVRRHVESSDELQLTFPELRPSRRRGEPWTQTAIVVDRPLGIRDPSLCAKHIGGKLPGSRLSWILADDLLTLENTSSEASREYTRRWLGSTVLDRLDAVDARIVVTNVPWFSKSSPEAIGDITYELEAEPFAWPTLTLDAFGDVEIRNTDWDSDLIRPASGDNPDLVRHRLTAHDHTNFARYAGEDPRPGWVDADDQVPLWPEKYPHEVLEEKRRLLSVQPGEFNRAFRCKPRDDTTATVKVDWIEKGKRVAIEMGMHRLFADRWTLGAVITAVDPAFTKGKKSNKTSILTFGLLSDGRRVVLENQVGKWSGPEIAQRVISAATRFGSIVVVEGNAAQRWLKDLIRDRNATISVRTATTGSNKNDPRFGVQSIFLELEDGMWLLPNDGAKNDAGNIITGKCPKGIDSLVSDLLEYDPARHTGDSLMSLWIGREYARRLGLLRPSEMSEGVSGLAAIRDR